MLKLSYWKRIFEYAHQNVVMAMVQSHFEYAYVFFWGTLDTGFNLLKTK